MNRPFRHIFHATRLCLFAALGASGALAALPAQSAPWTKSYANPAITVDLSSERPRVDLNGSDDLEFFRVRGVYPRSDGSFLVFNGATNQLRYFDAQGKFVSRAGGTGQGPGEYKFMAFAAPMPGDSLAILDASLRRVSVVNRTGAFVRSVSVAQSPAGLGSAQRLLVLPSGALLVGFSEVRSLQPQAAAIPFYERYFSVNNGSGLDTTNIRLLHSDHFVQQTVPERGGTAYWNLAFGRESSVAGTRTGFLVGDGTDWTVQEFSARGMPIGTHRIARAVRAVTAADRELFRAEVMRGVKTADSVINEKMLREMPYPRNKPAYSRVDVEFGGDRIWLQPYAKGGETKNEWLRLDPRTSLAEAVRFPARFRAMAFSATRVYGILRDGDDVEHVQVYDLTKLRK